MKTYRLISFFLIACILNSCGFIKEEKLGNNFILSEYDNADIQILYSEKTPANSGIQIIPMTILEYAYNDKWIIAKSGSKYSKGTSYWVIDKNFKVELITDNDSTLNVIRSHVTGPIDSLKFFEKLSISNINLVLKKI